MTVSGAVAWQMDGRKHHTMCVGSYCCLVVAAGRRSKDTGAAFNCVYLGMLHVVLVDRGGGGTFLKGGKGGVAAELMCSWCSARYNNKTQETCCVSYVRIVCTFRKGTVTRPWN